MSAIWGKYYLHISIYIVIVCAFDLDIASCFRKLQLLVGRAPPEKVPRFSHGPILFADHPDCGDFVGVLLDGRGLGGRKDNPRGDHATYSFKQSFRYIILKPSEDQRECKVELYTRKSIQLVFNLYSRRTS